MRADRLLSLLMLLQGRGKMTAQALAEELDVSERTIYRDIDALSLSGAPVYGESGPEGGYALLDSYRTRLTGLSTEEVRALFMLNVPAALADLGVSDRLRSALLKLSASLPARHSGDEMMVRQRFLLDSAPWQTESAPVAHLSTLQEAIWSDAIVEIAYSGPLALPVRQRVEAYALVAKNGGWHLIYRYTERMRIRRMSDLATVHLQEETFERNTKFDLAEFWRAHSRAYAERQSQFWVRVRIRPLIIPLLAAMLGDSVARQAKETEPGTDGWVVLELGFPSLSEARAKLLPLGYAAEVLSPLALRRSILDIAAQVVMRYSLEELPRKAMVLPEDRAEQVAERGGSW